MKPAAAAYRDVALGVAFVLWWLYFDFHAEQTLSRLKQAAQERGRLGRDLSYLLIPLVAGIIVCAAASRLVMAHPGRVLTPAGVVTLGAGPALFLLGSVAFKLRVYGAYRRKRAIALGFVAGATALAGRGARAGGVDRRDGWRSSRPWRCRGARAAAHLASRLACAQRRPIHSRMPRPVLVGYDPEVRDHAPVHFGVAVTRYADAPLIIASVQAGVRPVALSAGQALPFALAQADDDLVADCAPVVAQLAQELEADGIQAECRTLYGSSVPHALHEAAEAEDAGLLVVGSARRATVGRAMLGSTAERLLHGAPCPVAVVPRRWTRNGELVTIGVAYVDTEEGRAALRSAHALARRASAKLRVLTIVGPTLTMYSETEAQTAWGRAKYFEDVLGEYKQRALQEARQAVVELDGGVETETDVFVGDPAATLVRVSEHLDLLVCGSRGYGPIRAVLLGGVSRRVVAESRCPVIVLPRGVRASLEALLDEAPAGQARSR